MSENIKMKNATGGGPFREYKFAVLDEAIIKICGMTDSVEGFLTSQRFGLPSCSKRTNKKQDADKENVLPSLPKKQKTSEVEPTDEEMEILLAEAEDLIKNSEVHLNTSEKYLNTSDNSKHSSKPFSAKDATATKTTAEYLEKELELHRELCDKVGEGVGKIAEGQESAQKQQEEIKTALKKIYHSIDHLCDLQKKALEHQKLALEEQKRNNIQMENLRKRELEAKMAFKQRMLEIEEAKLQKFQ